MNQQELSDDNTAQTDIWDEEEPPRIRFLRRLVTIMGLILIFGFILVVAAIVVKLSNVSSSNPRAGQSASGFVNAEEPFLQATDLALPQGATALQITAQAFALLVLAEDAQGQMLLEFNPKTGELRHRLRIQHADAPQVLQTP